MKKDKTSILEHLLTGWLKGYLGYAWAILINIITIFVILAIFNSIYEDFETIIISIVILIYISLTSFVAGFGFIKQVESTAISEEFRIIRSMLKSDEYDDDYEKRQSEDNQNNIKKEKTKILINTIFASIIYIIVVFNIFGAL